MEEAIRASKESSKLDSSLIYAPRKKSFRPSYPYFKDPPRYQGRGSKGFNLLRTSPTPTSPRARIRIQGSQFLGKGTGVLLLLIPPITEQRLVQNASLFRLASCSYKVVICFIPGQHSVFQDVSNTYLSNCYEKAGKIHPETTGWSIS